MNKIIKAILGLLIVYIGAILLEPDLAPDFIPDMDSKFEKGGWIFFSRDKLGHFFLIGLAALALNFILEGRKVRIFKWSFLLGSVIIATVVTLEEFRQVPLTNRHFEMFDIFYNFAGILVLGRVGAWLAKKMNRSASAIQKK
ncbi:MAG: hypothetical protein AB8F74_08040 [Saprospiraceae bacterium]